MNICARVAVSRGLANIRGIWGRYREWARGILTTFGKDDRDV